MIRKTGKYAPLWTKSALISETPCFRISAAGSRRITAAKKRSNSAPAAGNRDGTSNSENQEKPSAPYIPGNPFSGSWSSSGKKKEAISALLADCSRRLKDIYRETPEGNGQRWLMIDLEDPDALYDDVLRLIHIRSGKELSKQKTNH